ncbi:hypothetical protein GCM10027277_14980 [Pseudoduganella ginsengisoli]|uniref:Uncharacterized protein n=1 Tax=Pseudoduganella ginsengisoli TaxID=1462440 RepID=A0A6L6PVK3_9BURK|nr:hypothetical protein [Pseudoduganella ginsengisoli]MTW01241.1 hypothetical protein [Pseudoduganella ginsengisoli]
MTIFSIMKRGACALAALLCVPAHAGQDNYNMSAVCDYILARYAEAADLAADRAEQAKSTAKLEEIELFRLEHNGTTVEYFVRDGRQHVMSVQQRLMTGESKRALLQRLGVKPARVGGHFEAGCDMSTLTLDFKQGRLVEMQASSQLD